MNTKRIRVAAVAVATASLVAIGGVSTLVLPAYADDTTTTQPAANVDDAVSAAILVDDTNPITPSSPVTVYGIGFTPSTAVTLRFTGPGTNDGALDPFTSNPNGTIAAQLQPFDADGTLGAWTPGQYTITATDANGLSATTTFTVVADTTATPSVVGTPENAGRTRVNVYGTGFTANHTVTIGVTGPGASGSTVKQLQVPVSDNGEVAYGFQLDEGATPWQPGDYAVTILDDTNPQLSATSKFTIHTHAESYPPQVTAATVQQGQTYDLTQSVTVPDYLTDPAFGTATPTFADVTPAGTIAVDEPGNYTGTVEVTYPDGSTETVEVPVTVVAKDAAAPATTQATTAASQATTAADAKNSLATTGAEGIVVLAATAAALTAAGALLRRRRTTR